MPPGTGLTDQAAGAPPRAAPPDESRRRWEAAMLDEIERIRQELRGASAAEVAVRTGGRHQDGVVHLEYWGRIVQVDWAELAPSNVNGDLLPPFDQAMILYHLLQSDGVAPAGRWISYRDLPGGEFYHQAYQGYTGRRLADAFGPEPADLDAAARSLDGVRLEGPAPYSWRFLPLPRIPLAACVWPGDDDLPAQASVLFDSHAGHHLPIDGLALLGAGLTGRLIRAAS